MSTFFQLELLKIKQWFDAKELDLALRAFKPLIKIESLSQIQLHIQHCLQQNQLLFAEWLLKEMVNILSEEPSNWSLLGIVEQMQGNSYEAEDALMQAYKLQPESVDFAYNLALFLKQNKRLNEALPYFAQAAQLSQNDLILWQDYGKAAMLLQVFEQAENAYKHAFKLQPSLENISALLHSLREQFKHQEAFELVTKYDVKFSENASFLYWTGLILMDMHHLSAAAGYFRGALNLEPDKLEYQLTLASCLKQMQFFSESLAILQDASTQYPLSADVWYNLGNLALEQVQHELASTYYQKAVDINPKLIEAWVNLAHIEIENNQIESALAFLERALELDPKHILARIHRGHCLLILGRYNQGWPDHEMRHWELFKMGYCFPGLVWEGQNLQDKCLLLLSEGGLGDSLHFVRFISDFAQRYLPAKLIFSSPSSLHPVLSDLADIDQYHDSSNQNYPAFDYCLRLLSLPIWLDIEKNTPTAAYLKPCKSSLPEDLAPKLMLKRPKIGITWRSGEGNLTGAKRSISLLQLAPVLDYLKDKAQVYSLQRDSAQHELSEWPDIIACGDYLTDFGITASILSHLDLLISVDTSIVHLAGGLAYPVWVMLPFAPDWRWGLESETTRWYPSARLFRQNRAGNWDDVIGKVLAELRIMDAIKY